ncbi:MAG: hypothetical protein OHK0031_00030 [Anaerolineales bacterium]
MTHLSWWLNFFNLPLEAPDLPAEKRPFYRVLSTALSFIPLMLSFNALGFTLVYGLAAIRILDVADSKLLWVALISLAAALLHLPIYPLLRQRRLQVVALWLLLINGLATASQILLWQNFTLPLALVSIAPVLIFLRYEGFELRTKIISVAFGALFAGLILFGESQISYQRLALTDLSSMAGIFVYGVMLTLEVALVLFNAGVEFKTIAARLVVTFALITIMSAVTTLVVAALGSFYYNRESVFNQLHGVANIKQTQIVNVLSSMDAEISIPVKDPLVYQRIQFLLGAPAGNFAYQFNYDLVRANLLKLREQSSRYTEIFIVDDIGQVVVSTNRSNEKQIDAGQRFFTRALQGENFAIERPAASGASATLLIMKPILKNGIFVGALVARATLDEIKTIMESKSGIADTLETYLVGTDYNAITATRTGAGAYVSTEATLNAVGSGGILAGQGNGIYTNYQNESVLGDYSYIPQIESVLVAEIKQQEVIVGILALMLSNLGVGLFTALMAFAIVFVTSRSISGPITTLAERAKRLAQGDMESRILIDRQDEIGQLAENFNTLSNELQMLVQTLEKKVEDRTQDLQKQANRLRVASEVARDATTSRNLDELLNRSAQLVLDRFGFYHTGIFLLDPQREYAVLRASPTEAGRAMLERNHRLKVGEVGIVGYVSASGEPRVALDTGSDATYFNNPLLPNTHSEMALPLKINNQVIGVLDVQSQESNAFDQDDIATLQTMADQLALAIQRIQLVEELQKNLSELEQTYQQFTLSSWRNYASSGKGLAGYQYDGNKLIPLSSLPTETANVLRQGRPVSIPGENKTILTVPVKLRDQVIGALKMEFNGENLTAETIKLAEDIAARLAIALENARLYTETQKQAARDRLTSEIAAKIGSSVNVETILRTAVQELGRVTPGAEVVVKIKKEQEN